MGGGQEGEPGERLLVDDGSCAPGKIKEVIGGDHVAVGRQGAGPAPAALHSAPEEDARSAGRLLHTLGTAFFSYQIVDFDR
jgi:hypothetical protein